VHLNEEYLISHKVCNKLEEIIDCIVIYGQFRCYGSTWSRVDGGMGFKTQHQSEHTR
jgi:hypothetical protein